MEDTGLEPVTYVTAVKGPCLNHLTNGSLSQAHLLVYWIIYKMQAFFRKNFNYFLLCAFITDVSTTKISKK